MVVGPTLVPFLHPIVPPLRIQLPPSSARPANGASPTLRAASHAKPPMVEREEGFVPAAYGDWSLFDSEESDVAETGVRNSNREQADTNLVGLAVARAFARGLGSGVVEAALASAREDGLTQAATAVRVDALLNAPGPAELRLLELLNLQRDALLAGAVTPTVVAALLKRAQQLGFSGQMVDAMLDEVDNTLEMCRRRQLDPYEVLGVQRGTAHRTVAATYERRRGEALKDSGLLAVQGVARLDAAWALLA